MGSYNYNVRSKATYMATVTNDATKAAKFDIESDNGYIEKMETYIDKIDEHFEKMQTALKNIMKDKETGKKVEEICDTNIKNIAKIQKQLKAKLKSLKKTYRTQYDDIVKQMVIEYKKTKAAAEQIKTNIE